MLPVTLAVALFMENMDASVLATALPVIAVDVGTSPITLKLALTSYFVALAIFIPVSGWMADRFGASRIFRVALGVFVVGSVFCAMSGSLLEFVLSRFLQGMGGAMMTPVARLVLVRATPRGELVTAMAWLTAPALIGPLVGPPVGGFLATYLTWHWIFLINVPIGLIGIWLAGRVLPDLEVHQPGRLDARGFLLSGLAAAGVVFGLSVVSLPALPPAVGIATVGIGLAAALCYVFHARRTPRPLLDLSLLSNPALRAGLMSGALFRIGSGAVPFLLPLMFQLGFGMTPFQSGMLTFVSAFGAIALKFFAARFLRYGGFRLVLLVSVGISALLIGLHAFFSPATAYPVIFAVLIGAGFMRSLYFTASNALIFAEIDDRQAAQASALSAVSQQISVALGVAMAGMILEAHAAISGEAVGLATFSIAFLAVAAVTATAALPLLALSPDAGGSVSGHRRRNHIEPQP